MRKKNLCLKGNMQHTTPYKVRLSDFLFVLAYGLAVFRGALGNTTFLKYFSTYGVFLYIILSIITAFIFIKIIYVDRIAVKNLIVISFAVIILGFSFWRSGYSELLILLILFVGSRNVQIRSVVKTHFVVYGIVTATAIVCSLTGVIENYCINSGASVVYALGNTYPTDFAAGILSLLLDFSYLKADKWKTRYSLYFILIAYALYRITHARTSSILIIVLAIIQLLLLTSLKNIIDNDQKLRIITGLLFPIFATVSIIVQTMFGRMHNAFLGLLDVLLTYRLSYGYQAIQKYGLQLWGRRIDFVGAGWGTKITPDNRYFYVDNGYLQCALLYGIIVLAAICIGYFYMAVSKKTKNDSELTIILILYSIWGIIEPRIFYLIYAPFLVAIGITLMTKSRLRRVD